MCTLTTQFTEECVSYGNMTEAIFTNNADLVTSSRSMQTLMQKKVSACQFVVGRLGEGALRGP